MKKVAIALALALLGSYIFSPAIGQAGTAVDSVRSMLDEVTAIQNNPKLQGQESRGTRRGLIRKVILKNFDFEDMAKEALGQDQWGRLSKAQRSEYKSIFQDLFLDSYTRLVLDFLKKEKIEYGEEESARGSIVVKTVIRRLEDRIPVHYLLLNVNKEWLVNDVTIDGVSIVGNYRRSFLRVIKQESFDGLLKKMRLQQKAARGEK